MKSCWFTSSFFLLILFINSCTNPTEIDKKVLTKLDSLNVKAYNFGKEKKYDSAIFFANSLLKESSLIADTVYINKAYSRLSFYNNKLERFYEAINYSERLLFNAFKLKDTLGIAKTSFRLAKNYSSLNELDKAYKYYNDSKENYLLLKDSVEVAKNLRAMSRILADVCDYSEAERHAIDALKFLKNKDKKITSSTYHTLSIINREQKKYDSAIDNINKAIHFARNSEDKQVCLNTKGVILTKRGDYIDAINLYSELLNDSITKNNSEKYARVLDNYTYTKWLNNENDNLEKDFRTALQIRNQINDEKGLVSSNKHLSEYFFNKNPNKALKHANAMYRISSNLKASEDRLDALKILKDLVDLKTAKKYSDLYIKIKDSLTDTRDQAKIKYSEIRFNYNQKENENLVLKAEKTKEKLEKEKQKRRNIILIILLAAILISGFFYYKSLKSRHKKEKIQQVYKTETRISKKVHDEVANDLYHVMVKLQNDSDIKENVLDDLEDIYIKTRDISKENSAIDVTHNFNSLLNDLLLSYKSENVSVITRNLSKVNWETIPEVKKTTLYRVLQELMTNMRKHSKASIVMLTFSNEKRKIEIDYKDNGIGCDMKKQNGLQNAENRMQTINGSITFESEINNGFKAKIIV